MPQQMKGWRGKQMEGWDPLYDPSGYYQGSKMLIKLKTYTINHN